MKRILFVDDEPNVLHALRRMLFPMRKEWSMSFAASGGEALQMLAAEPCDVIVSDMRMSGMDGAALLGHVRVAFPGVARILLSGQSDREALLRSVGAAHQYLSKPCDPQVLRDKIASALALRDLLASQPLAALAAQLGAIPSLPAIYMEIRRAIDEQKSSREVGAIVERDPAMSAKVLQLVNSSFFGRPRPLATPSEAVVFLGVDTIGALVLSTHVFAEADAATVAEFELDATWQHCWQVSALARRLAADQTSERGVENEAALAGLLHEVGRVVLCSHKPAAYRDALQMARARSIPLWQAEHETFQASAAALGAYVLGLWGLSGPTVEAVAWHHRPSDCPSANGLPLTAVHVANALVAVRPSLDRDDLDLSYLERVGCADRVAGWRRTEP